MLIPPSAAVFGPPRSCAAYAATGYAASVTNLAGIALAIDNVCCRPAG